MIRSRKQTVPVGRVVIRHVRSDNIMSNDILSYVKKIVTDIIVIS